MLNIKEILGKSCFAIRYCSDHFVNRWEPSIEDSYTRQTVIDGNACRIEILDGAGQEEFSSLRGKIIKLIFIIYASWFFFDLIYEYQSKSLDKPK